MRSARYLVWMVVFTIFSTVSCLAQGGSNGIISGNVRDSTGAVVQHAQVQITNTETNVTETLTTTDAGDYYSPPLHPGLYRVTVTQTGFQTSQSSVLQLTVDQKARVDISLTPGSTSDTVQVNTSSVQLNTDTAEIATTITSKQVLDLPINSRNFVSLMFLTAGTVQTGGESGGSNATNSSAKGNGAISINGNRSSSNQYLIDGMFNNDTVYQTPAISPSIDAVQEFKTQSGAYSAEFGGSANQVNISFRNGTNTYHGTAFEFLRNDAFDAQTKFEPKKQLLRQNQFGYTLGGPVSIPRLYNGKDRTFFFANYEGIRKHTSSSVLTIVPTQSQLGIGTPNGAALIPSTAIDGGVCQTGPCNNNALLNPYAGYTPFAKDGNGNYVIPDSAISNFGRVVRSHIPVPNASIVLTPGGPTYNYNSSLSTPTIGNQQNYRIDQNLGAKNSIYFRYSRAEFIVTNAGLNLLPEGQQNSPSTQTSYVGQYTRIFTSNIINQVRVGYLLSDNAVIGVAGNPADIAALKFKGLYTLTSTPFVQVGWNNNGTTKLAGFGGSANNDPEIFNQPTYDYSDILTITHGKHTVGMGGEFRTLTLNDGGNANQGTVNFDGQFSNSHVGDLLLGVYQNANGSTPTPYSTPGEAGTIVHIKHNFLAFFIQDNWKFNQKLSLNYGVRYDFNSAPYNQNNHFGYFDPTGPGYLDVADNSLITSGIGGSVYKYAGGPSAYKGQKLTFAPRTGFTYLVTNSTVLRGGYGLYFDSSEDSETRQFAEFYPYSVRQNLTYARTYTNPSAPFGTADTLFPAITTLAPVSSANLGFLLTQLNAKKNPYVQSYNLSLERSFGAGTKLELDYVGNVGRHLEGRNNFNAPFAYNPAAPTSVAARTPYKNFGDTIIVDSFSYPSNYNAFNAIFQTQKHGATLLAVYTWSKSLDLKSASAGVDGDTAGWVAAQDPHNLAAEYGKSGYDVGQRVVVSLVDELPIGKGKLLDFHNGVANAVLGGFQVNGIATFQGGFPFSVNASDNSGLNGQNYSQRANVSGNPILPRGQRSAAKWFNTSAFSATDPGIYGNSARNLVRGPGISNFDLSAFKNFNLYERLTAQFRIESFNTLNHVQYSNPDSNIGTKTTPNTNFGTITGTRIPGRIVQLGAKIIF